MQKLYLLFNLAWVFLACPFSLAAEARAVSYVTTIVPLQMIVSELAGERASVSSLVPPGVSPHIFEPRPSAVKKAADARILFLVHPNIDSWGQKVSSPKKVNVFDLLPQNFRRNFLPEAGFSPGNADPHFWLDPLAVQALLPALVSEMCQSDPAGCPIYRKNSEIFSQKLANLQRELEQTLKPLAGRQVVLQHPSFQYFLLRYQMQLAGVIESEPGREVSARHLQSLASLIRQKNVMVFSEVQLGKKEIQVLAETCQCQIHSLDPIGGGSLPDYVSLLRFNSRVFLQGQK